MQLPPAIAPLAQVAPILRGACSMEKGENSGAWRRLIFDFRTGAGILNVTQYCAIDVLARQAHQLDLKALEAAIHREYVKDGKIV